MSSLDAEKKKLLKRLKGFCAAMGDDLGTLDPALRARIDESILELSRPKKVAIAGLADARHHDLASFFVGVDLVSPDSMIEECPIIHIRHGAAEKTHAFIGEKTHELPGCQIDKVIATGKATKVDLELTTPITAEMNFSIMPVYDVQENRTNYLFELLNDVDVLIWCSNASEPWQSRERRLWFTIPDELKTRSILALTEADLVTGDAAQAAFDKKCALLAEEFNSMSAISVDTAREAAPNGNLVDPEKFAESGGPEMLRGLLALLAAGSQDALDRARAVRLELDEIPLGGMTAAPVDPVPAPMVKISNSKKTTPDTPSAPISIETFLTENVATCIAAAEQSADGDYGDLFEQMDALLAGLIDHAAGELDNASDPESIRSQLKEARDLVGLLRYEKDEKAAHDAAAVVRQVSIDLWTCMRPYGDTGVEAASANKKAS